MVQTILHQERDLSFLIYLLPEPVSRIQSNLSCLLSSLFSLPVHRKLYFISLACLPVAKLAAKQNLVATIKLSQKKETETKLKQRPAYFSYDILALFCP